MNRKIFNFHGLEDLILLKCYVTQSDPYVQLNPYQNTNDIFNINIKKKHCKIRMKLQKSLNRTKVRDKMVE